MADANSILEDINNEFFVSMVGNPVFTQKEIEAIKHILEIPKTADKMSDEIYNTLVKKNED